MIIFQGKEVVTLASGLTDIKIPGETTYQRSPFIAGDELTLLEAHQQCSQVGCCQLKCLFQHSEWNGNKPFWGFVHIHGIDNFPG